MTVLEASDCLRELMPSMFSGFDPEARLHILAAALGGSIADHVWPIEPQNVAEIVAKLVAPAANVRHAQLASVVLSCEGHG